MPSPHIAFASSAVLPSPLPSSQPVSRAAVARTLPSSTSTPITAPNFVLNTISQSRGAYYYNTPSSDPSQSLAIPATGPLNASNNATTTQTHIALALSASSAASIEPYEPRPFPSQQTPKSFLAASLPRTSSLLPPPRLTVNKSLGSSADADADADANANAVALPLTSSSAYPSGLFRSPVNAAAPIAPSTVTDLPVVDSTTDTTASTSRRRPSRSSSLGIVVDNPHDLNRRSNSTASSRASIAGGHPLVHRRQRSASFSRPLSIESVSSQTQQPRDYSAPAATAVPSSTADPAPHLHQSPRKLQKSRPGTANSGSPLRESPSARASRRPSPPPFPPFSSLPPIVTLPSLEQEVQGGSAFLSGRMAPQQRRPHLRQASSEDNTQSFYFGDAPRLASSTPLKKSPSATYAGKEIYATAGGAATTTSKSPDTTGGGRPTIPYSMESEVAQPVRGYARSRSQNAKGSTDSTRSRDRASRPPSQKAMLSRALQKANTAVQLDNAGNIEGATDAYTEACELLQHVLLKTPGEEDKRKLEAIRVTYTARIKELEQLAITQKQDSRPLPERPASSNAPDRSSLDMYTDDDDGDNASDGGGDSDEKVVIETATVTRIYNDDEQYVAPTEPRSVPSYAIPISSASPRLQQSAFMDIPNDSSKHASSLLNGQYTLQSSFSRSPRREFAPHNDLHTVLPAAGVLQPPLPLNQYVPPPLSPRRINPPPAPFDQPSSVHGHDAEGSSASAARGGSDLRPPTSAARNAVSLPSHSRAASHESVSWLDPIDESGASAASSVHSRTSSLGIRRKHIRAASGETEAEFDAALDDAIEAAYDDGFEQPASGPPNNAPREYGDYGSGDAQAQIMRSLKKVELAKERVRQSEREAKAFERQLRLRQLKQQQEQDVYAREISTDFLDAGNDSDDEERVLEEMTNGYAIEDFAFGSKSKNSKPPPMRESDSSEFTSRTWHSSLASNPPTATTVLSTVTESTVVPPHLSKGSTNTMPPPPTQALPQLPPQPTRPSATQSPVRGGNAQSVRNRRLSGQNMKQLKIETTKLGPPSNAPPPATAGNSSNSSAALSASAAIPQQPRTAGFLVQQRQALSAGPARPGSSAANASLPFSRQAPTPSPNAGATMYFGASPSDSIPPPNFPPPTPPVPHGTPFADNDSMAGRSGSPSTGRPLRKNFSSSSLKSMRSRNMSVTNLEGGSDISPGTPLSNQFMLNSRLPDVPSLPTPITTTFKDRLMVASNGVGGLHLLESDFHSPSTPGSPNPMSTDAPVPLEACPTDTMLRPFWLMRCLYQTLVHPRGGYLSNKLFVPSDVWKVKNVKLKNLDEKISNCDLLTAALLKLARVDTCDADAVLEEMQALEGVLEQVQNVLGRKLGNDVGVQSTNALFKEASTGVETENGSGAVPRTSSVSSNARSFSWRRLRSKNSSAGLSSNYSAVGRKNSVTDGGPKDGGILPSLPMTTHPTSRPAKRDVASARFTGPYALYMGALARLFDAAQSIDQIARQVEDPGLRHADKTQVGLELCTRHAAEFFAFYICRFVLSDVSLLLEKFIKRGSEWVLA
ncbi:MIT domain containing protein [Niveomyces insectorum RCEF 264]|uniref:MIT domain containing protein n=1 Tax=Niveomyces insectorum RCEF 264 TaxID=1081102 RepID=A0A162JBU0_9HYPO|nr:MIT domain containing protein [Niveomyces insectorum RCEF 264]